MTVMKTTGWVPTDSFGGRLLLVRHERGLTIQEAADRCGLHYATWSTWERGRMPAGLSKVVSAVSKSLGVDRDWLMWGGPLSSEPEPGPHQSVAPQQQPAGYSYNAKGRRGTKVAA